MSLRSAATWLKAPADRDVIRRWTCRPGEDHCLLLPPPADPDRFAFLAVGDTGDSEGSDGVSPQDAVAAEMAREARLPETGGDAELVLHTGDVVYMTGEQRLYDRNFRRPYAPFLTSGSTPEELVFRLPFLPVPGNHDYYDPGGWSRWLAAMPALGAGLRALSREVFSYSLPQRGSGMGRVWMEAFTHRDPPEGALPYEVGERTRLPNRYFRFSHGCADFFALDTNTLEAPAPDGRLQRDRERAARRVRELSRRAAALEHELRRDELALERWLARHPDAGEGGAAPPPRLCERLKLLSETALDVQRELAREQRRMHTRPDDFDAEQLRWLAASLEESRRDRPGAWRILWMHHPLFTTITNHAERSDVQGVRENLLELVRGSVDLVLSGHSHSFEWIRAAALPHTALVVTGGGGQPDLRRSVLDPRRIRKYGRVYHQLRGAGVTECVAAGRGPAGPDGLRGFLFHFVRVEVTPERLLVRPVGVRRLRSGYRREEPLPVHHARHLPAADPPWEVRSLHGVEVHRDQPPRPLWG